MNSKQIKRYILTSSCDIDYLQTLLIESPSSTIEAIFNSLYTLLKKYAKNKEFLNCLVYLIRENISCFSEKDLRLIISRINQLNNIIYHNLTKREKIMINDFHYEIGELFKDINNQLAKMRKDESVDENIIYLEYLIFQDKDFSKIKKFILRHRDILQLVNEYGDNIFSSLLKLYVSLSEESIYEIEYFHEIIMFFMNSGLLSEIMKEKDKYLKIIDKDTFGKKHILELREKFERVNLVSIEELESMYHLSFHFSNNIMEEMILLQKDNDKRYDFTNQACITIDDEGARCLDDALYLEKNRDGTFDLYIHITDIPSFIPYDSLVNMEARKREESLYLRDRVIPMYPEQISYDICSLLDHNDRNVISLILKVDSNFDIIEDSMRLVKGRINVKNRLTYDEVDKNIINKDNSLSNMLKNLFMIAIKRRNNNKAKELYRKYENIFSNNKSHESLHIEESLSSNIVQEMMILLNYMISKYFKENSFPFVYREVLFADDVTVRKQLELLSTYHANLLKNEDFINGFEENLIRSEYVHIPSYHQGLHLSSYSHCSSPARRYADSFCQYLIYDFIFNKELDEQLFFSWEDRIKELVPYLNERKEQNELFIERYNYLSREKLVKIKNKRK